MAPLVLFDIDGTLLRGAAKLHLAAMRDAFAAVLDVDGDFSSDGDTPRVGGISVAGMIDREVFAAAARAAGVGRDELTGRYRELLETFHTTYAEQLHRGADPGIPVPGATETLEQLAAAGARVALLTGNVHTVAQAKLAAVGLARFFTFHPAAGFGAYARDRAALVPAAVSHVERSSGPVDPTRTALVGDTPTDITAARTNRVHAVGVLTGAGTLASLHDAGAELVLPNLAGAAPTLLGLLG